MIQPIWINLQLNYFGMNYQSCKDIPSMSNLLIPSELVMENILAAKVAAMLLYKFPTSTNQQLEREFQLYESCHAIIQSLINHIRNPLLGNKCKDLEEENVTCANGRLRKNTLIRRNRLG